MNVRRSLGRWLPLTATDWNRMGGEVRAVLSAPRSLLLAVVVAVVALSLFVLPENIRLVLDVVVFGGADPSIRLQVLSALYPFVGGAIDPFADALLVFLAGATGITVAVIARQIRDGGAGRELGTGSTGVLLVTATGGCAACGSAVLAAVAGVGAAGTLAALPLGGMELQLLAGALLIVSLHRLAEPERCLIPTDRTESGPDASASGRGDEL